MQKSIHWLTLKLISHDGEGPSEHGTAMFGLLAGLVLAAICLLAYIPAIQCGFIWDDNRYVTENPLLSEPDGLHRIWFSKDSPSQYFPMVYTSFRLEYALWKLNPVGYHITNILLHVINALLLWRLLRYLSIPGAWLAAAIFAVHPVQVESVAWISERKNLLMALFFFLSLLSWARFADRSHQSKGGWLFYVFSLLLYMLALLSKTTACTLPVALVLLLWLKHIPVNSKRWLQIAPYILLGLAMGIFTIWWEQQHQGMFLVDLGLNPVERLLIAGRALWFYIGKLIWPTNLAFSYPKWDINPADLSQYTWLLACVMVAWCIWFWRNRIGRGPVAALTFFAGTLFPMLGFFSLFTFVYTYVADHYQYVGSVGPITLFAAIVYRILLRLEGLARNIVKIAFVFVLAVLGTFTWRQCHIYKDEETLWRDTIKKNPSSWLANNNLGAIFLSQNKLGDAINYFNEAMKVDLNIDINRAFTYSNLAQVFELQGDLDQAVACYRQALKLNPIDAQVHNRLGGILKMQGNLDEAISHYQRAAELDPDHRAGIYNSLGVALRQKGELNEAIAYYRKALKLTSKDARIYYNLANALAEQGDVNEAADRYYRAIELAPDYASAYNNLGILLENQGKFEQAIDLYRKGLSAEPDDVAIRNNFVRLLVSQGKVNEALWYFRGRVANEAGAYFEFAVTLLSIERPDLAVEHLRKAQELAPDWPVALMWLAKVLVSYPQSQFYNPAEAVVMAEQAATLTMRQDANALAVLSEAYAAAGQFDRAIKTAEDAMAMASRDGNDELANYIRSQMQSYMERGSSAE